MNTPNPLIPQGSLLERTAKGKPHLRVAYFIVAAHMLFLGFLLLSQGCKKEDQTAGSAMQGETNESLLPPLTPENLYNSNAAVSPTNLTLPDLVQTSAPPVSSPAGIFPAPALNPIEQPVPATREHVIVKGDTFSSLAKEYHVSIGAIAKANPGVDPSRLQIGQKLVIPPEPATAPATLGESGENVYVVKSGDTLSQIATTHGTTVKEIKAINGLKTDRIKVGDKLKMPPKGAPTTTPPAGTSNL